MKSIKNKLTVNFIVIIVFTVLVLEVLIINTVRQNYYKNLEDSLYSQLKVSSEIYTRYFSDSSIYDNVLNNVDTFWKQSSAQVQIVDINKKILMDSIGVIPESKLDTEDIEEALNGGKGTWMGKVSYDDERVMAVSYPLKSGTKIVGVLRFVTSLREVNKDVAQISYLFVFIGLAVVSMSCLLSIILANTIINPVKEVTKTAEKMAAGNFSIQSVKRRDDEIGKLSDTLNYMASEIIKKDQLKNDFISSVSHELRTPLTSIKGWAVTLKSDNGADSEILADGLEIIEKESDRLTSMVEELLDFSRFVSGKVTIKKEPVDLQEFMRYLKRQLEPRAERDKVVFDVTWDQDLPTVITDGNRLKQVFINLLDNAFKFTSPGGKVSFTASHKPGLFYFSVIDNGCGIPAEDLPRVKEKFFKGRNSKSRNGIGLSICDEIIKLMNGSFEIKSEVNKGTEILITLPLREG